MFPDHLKTLTQESPPSQRREQKWRRRSYQPRNTLATRDDDDDDDDDVVHDKPNKKSKPNLQERNRLAASKCRRNKRRWEHDLEEGNARLERQNSRLREAQRALTGEVTKLKMLLIAHAGCGHNAVDLWIRNEADKYVDAASCASRGNKAGRSCVNSERVADAKSSAAADGVQ
jgi:hypothetical protein